MTRILGIDPGSRITGFGIIEVTRGRISYVESGCIRVGDGELGGRLKQIFEGIRDIITTYVPNETAIEKVFVHRNVDSALKLGQARGAAICAITLQELPVSEYSPTEIKKATVGKGHAAKGQVQHMVQALLKLPAAPQADAADALAVALCHAHLRQSLLAVEGSRGARGGRWR